MKTKRCIVTGSTSGIGQGIARFLAKEGHAIAVCGLGDKKEVSKFIKELCDAGAKDAFFLPGDLSNPDDAAALVSTAVKKWGGVDVIINNCGIQYVANVEDFGVDQWNKVLATNLSSYFYTSTAILPYLKKQKWGRIINIASVHGLVASKQKSAYVAAKHGVIGLTKVTALENAESGVTANAICPGWVLTPLVEKQIKDIAARDGLSYEKAQEKLLTEKEPTKKFTKIEDIAAFVSLLISDYGDNITGSSFTLDGGWTSQ